MFASLQVRHPGVALRIAQDFVIMGVVARLLDSVPFLAWLRVHETVRQFSHTMTAQVRPRTPHTSMAQARPLRWNPWTWRGDALGLEEGPPSALGLEGVSDALFLRWRPQAFPMTCAQY